MTSSFNNKRLLYLILIISSCASLNEQNYSELLEAFQETHDEANRLVLSNRLKELNSWLEKRVNALEEELEKS